MNTNYNLLVVDDDAAYRAGVTNLLHSFGKDMNLTIREASTGAEAMEILERFEADCILLDYRLPGGSGLEWLEQMAQGPARRAVIMVTGDGSEEVAVTAMKNGAVDYLVKGAIAKENLFRTIRNALSHLEMQRTIARQQEELLQAERQRVIVESLGAACHHLGQPATVITTYLELMRRNESDPGKQAMIANCFEAAQSMAVILDRLRQVSEYRTEPYLASGDDGPPRSDERILAI